MTNDIHTDKPASHSAGHSHTAAQAAPDQSSARRQIEAFRRQKDKFFLENPDSPVLQEDKDQGKGLSYFDFDEKYRVNSTLVPEADPGIFRVQTTTGDHKEYTRIGRLEFEIDGQKLCLTAFMPPADEPLHGNRIFVPFRDKTSGKESYGAGRYLDLNKRESGEYVIDFNRAYNPYCAYSPYYSCPLPPGENKLPIEIRAGEKMYHEDH